MRRQHLTAALIFLILTLILTNPLALHVWNAVEDKQDALLNTWITAWVGHALITDPMNLFNANIFYPYPNSLAFSELLIPPSLFALPLTLAANNPIFGYNLALLAMLWLDAFGMYLFVFDLTRRREAAWIASAIYAFNPFNLGNFAQLQLLTLGFLPIALIFLRRILRPDRSRADLSGLSRFPLRDAFLFSLFFILQSLSSFYYALLAGFAVGIYLLWWLIRQRANLLPSLRRVMIPLIASVVFILIVVTPFLLPYLDVQRELGFQRRVQESEPFSASLKQFTEVSPQNLVYGKLLAPNPVVRLGGYPLDNLFPGLVALGLAAIGLFASRRIAERWFLLLLLVVAFILALGPRLYITARQATDITLPYRWLYDVFPPMRALRAPVRFEALIIFVLAASAGLGASALFARVGKRARWLALGVITLIALEYLAIPAANVVPLPVASEIPAVYKWLAQQPRTVALELPMMGPSGNGELDISNQYFTTYHWQKTPDGYSGFVPPRRGEIAYELEGFPSPRSIALLRALDVQYVIDHTPVPECYVWSGPVGYYKPREMGEFQNPCVYELPPVENGNPPLEKSLYLPSEIATGAPFNAYLLLINRDVNSFAVKPTDQAHVKAIWSDGHQEQISFFLPLVTSSVSVVPIRLTAPDKPGTFELRLQANDALLGQINVRASAKIGAELAREVVLPVTVEPQPFSSTTFTRGSTIPVPIRWRVNNKIDGYYSASVRLVDEKENKVANVDRQPSQPTLLWRPETVIDDTFDLTVPQDIPSGKYRIELLMYQGNTNEDALLLNEEWIPQPTIVLGEVEIR